MKTAIALRIITMLFHYIRNNLRKFAKARSNWGDEHCYANEPGIIARHCSLFFYQKPRRSASLYRNLCENILLFLINARARAPSPHRHRRKRRDVKNRSVADRYQPDTGSQLILIIINKVPKRCNATRARAAVKN